MAIEKFERPVLNGTQTEVVYNLLKGKLSDAEIPPTQRDWDVFARPPFNKIITTYPELITLTEATRTLEEVFYPDLSIREKKALWTALLRNNLLTQQRHSEFKNILRLAELDEDKLNEYLSLAARLPDKMATLRLLTESSIVEDDEISKIGKKLIKNTRIRKKVYQRKIILKKLFEQGLDIEEIAKYIEDQEISEQSGSGSLEKSSEKNELSHDGLIELLKHELGRAISSSKRYIPGVPHPSIDKVTNAQVRYLLCMQVPKDEIIRTLGITPVEFKRITNPPELTLEDVISKEEYPYAQKIMEDFGRFALAFSGNAGFSWDNNFRLNKYLLTWDGAENNSFLLECFIRDNKIDLSLMDKQIGAPLQTVTLKSVTSLKMDSKGFLQISLGSDGKRAVWIDRNGIFRVTSPKTKHFAL